MLKRAFLTNSSGIMLSRIFGFIRDLCMANFLGAGLASDVFFVAFKFPNLFRRIFGEGAFTQSFLPSLVLATQKSIFSVLVLGIFSIIIVCLSILVAIFSNSFTTMIAFGFSKEDITLAAPIVAICFWYLFLVFVVTFFATLLQYKNSFWASAYNTALLNIAMILALFLGKDSDDMDAIYILSYGVLIGGILQILLFIYPLYHYKMIFMLKNGITHIYSRNQSSKNMTRFAMAIKDTKAFFRQFFPALLGSSTAQIASFIDTLLASFLASGSISYLYYANRIFQLPLAIFAIAISTALFPSIAKSIKNSDLDRAKNLMKKSFWFLVFALSICVLGGMYMREEIIFLLYEHGRFTQEDSINTSLVFAMYMLGLLPFGLSRIFSLWLYSHSMQGKAAKISAISLGCSTLLSVIFILLGFGAWSLALSGSISGVILLVLNLRIFGFGNFKEMVLIPKNWLFLVMILSFSFIILFGIKIIFKEFM